jgi:hypothetical protein
VLEAFPGVLGAVPSAFEIAVGHDPEGTDRRKQPAVGPIQLVGPIPFRVSNELPLGVSGEAEFANEDITRIVGAVLVPFVPASAATEVASPRVVPIAGVVVSRIVPVPHALLRRQYVGGARTEAMNLLVV